MPLRSSDSELDSVIALMAVLVVRRKGERDVRLALWKGEPRRDQTKRRRTCQVEARLGSKRSLRGEGARASATLGGAGVAVN